jgi:hypothetical protein
LCSGRSGRMVMCIPYFSLKQGCPRSLPLAEPFI